jgi:hypothetical protein
MNFERGGDPFINLKIRIAVLEKKVEDWLLEHNMDTKATYKVKLTSDTFKVYVTGNIMLEDFEILSLEGIKDKYKVVFVNFSGRKIILTDLNPQDIYDRIKKSYEDILDKYEGKTKINIEDLPKTPIKISKASLQSIQRAIENSKIYIRSLPPKPTPKDILDLIENVLSGSLKYGMNISDDDGFDNSQYANAIRKKISNLNFIINSLFLLVYQTLFHLVSQKSLRFS